MAAFLEAIRTTISRVVGSDDLAKADSPSTQMAVALNLKHGPTYAGTVPAAEKARRRAKNRRARTARAMHRRAR